MPSLYKFIFEDEAVVGIDSPSSYRYLKILRFFLANLASWPLKEIGQHESKVLTIIVKYICLSVCLCCSLGSILYIIIHSRSVTFLEKGHFYITMLLNFLDASRVCTLTFSSKYRDVTKDFLTKIHLFFYKDNSEYAMKTHKQVHMISHLFTLCLTFQMISGLILFNLIPMYSNYSSGKYKPGGLQNSTFEHSLYFSYPFNTSTDMNGYIVVCVIHWILSYMCASWICMFDLLLSLMVFHLWGHFKILINNVNSFPKPSIKSNMLLTDGMSLSVEKYAKKELPQVLSILKKCIDYHREIIHFTDRMSDTFGPMLLLYYGFHQTACCLLLLECSQMTTEALMRYLPLTIIAFQQLIQLSIIFELVGSESEKLKDAVYGIPWESMNVKHRKIVIFFLKNVQEPVHVKALGVADVGVKTMFTIIKTSLSYFTFLRSC